MAHDEINLPGYVKSSSLLTTEKCKKSKKNKKTVESQE